MASAVSRDSCSVCAEVAFGLVPTVWEMTGQYSDFEMNTCVASMLLVLFAILKLHLLT
jgi:hypothetical protein